MATLEIFDVSPITIQTKQSWSENWSTKPELEPINAEVDPQDGGFFNFRLRYGDLESHGGHPVGGGTPQNIDRHWFRALDANGQVFFQGRVQNDRRDIHSNPNQDNPSGIQTFIATDAIDILRRRDHFTSRHKKDASTTVVIDSIPSFNSRDRQNLLVGNRSTSKYAINSKQAYVFGDSEIWTAEDVVEYLVATTLTSLETEPNWTIEGINLLSGIKENFEFDAVETTLSMLQKVINRRFGVGFHVVPTHDGYALRIFGLLDQAISFGTETIPANTNVVTVNANATVDAAQIVIENSSAEVYNTIRVIGNPIVICASFQRDSTRNLIKMWNDTAKLRYDKDAMGSEFVDADDNDNRRREELYANVYTGWAVDFENADSWPLGTIPTFNRQTGVIDASQRGRTQNLRRNVLTWLPLFEGVEYDGPNDTNYNDVNFNAALRQPNVLIYGGLFNPRYHRCDDIDIDLLILPSEAGFRLKPPINHYVGKGELHQDFRPSNFFAEYSTQQMIATLAWESDERIAMEYTTSPPAVSQGIKTIYVDADLWYLAPNTVLDASAQNLVTSGNPGFTVRDDSARILRTMAGAIARYGQPRARARITVKNFVNWLEYLGHIVEIQNDGTTANTVRGPLTSISWTFEPSYSTSLKTGYAE